jgi:hypothetical protein
MQRLQGLQGTEHAQHTVELAAGGLGVEVAAHGDGRHIAALALPPREHGTHVVDGHGAAQRLGTGAEPVAHLPVEIGQGEPADAAFRRAADRRRLHQVAPQALGVDRQVAHDSGLLRARSFVIEALGFGHGT